MFLQMLTESRNKTETPGQRATSLAGRVFSDVNQINPDLVKQIYEVLTNRYELPTSGKPHQTLMDSATIGMAVVLRAYDIETRHQLIEALGRVNGDDLGVVNTSIEEIIPKLDSFGGPSILEEIINMPRIPEHQINLNFCLREASRNVAMPKEFFKGATSMYTILSRLWGRLIPQSWPTTPPT